MNKLKTTLKTVVENCKIIEDSNDLELLGSKEACECYNKHNESKLMLTSDNEFSANFAGGDKFYYRLVVFREKIKMFTEVGICILLFENDKFFIKREHSLLLQDHHSNQPVFNTRFISHQDLRDDEYCLIEAAPLDNLLQIMIDPNVMVYNSESGCPSALYVEKNCLIGRLDEGISSIPIGDIFKNESFKEEVINCIIRHHGQINLNSACKISNHKVCFEKNVTLEENELEGTLFYDQETKKLKLFNGSNWLTLSVDNEV